MRVLITGMSGFAGRHLAALLLQHGHEVFGTARRREGWARLRPLASRFPAWDEDRLRFMDVGDAAGVARVVAEVVPDALFHLAGMAAVGGSHHDPALVFATNALGTLHLLAAVRQHRRTCRVVTIGSGDAYGLLDPTDLPVSERCPFRPLSPYGASKAAADLIAHQWARGYGLDIVRVRPFNHIGPGQTRGFVCPDFAEQIVAIENHRQAPSIAVGNLDVVRDFTDVRDVVAGYVAACERGTSGEAYNICSGVGRSIRDLLDTMIALSGLRVDVTVDPSRVRTTDVPTVVGSAQQLRAATGWAPRHEWRHTLRDVLDDWRQRSAS